MSQSFAPEALHNHPPFGFLVRIDRGTGQDSEFCGTGFLVAPRHVLTCKHVVRDCGPDHGPHPGGILVRYGDQLQEFRRGTLIGVCYPEAALIELEEPVSAAPIRLIRNIRAEHEQVITKRYPVAAGFSEILSNDPVETRIAKVVAATHDVRTGQLLDLQIEGGRIAGMSGSPALVQADGEWACLGMLYLGGERAATSRIMLASILLPLIDKHAPDRAPDVDADDIFEPDAGNPRDRPARLAKEYTERFVAYATSAGRVRATEQPIPLALVYVNRRRQENRILDLFATSANREKGTWVSIEGQGGTGKTSLLWYLYDKLSTEPGATVQPFAAQDMTRDCSAEKKLVAHRLEKAPGRLVVMIDTLDLIVGRNDEHLRSFLAWLRTQRTFVVTTCRPLEARRLAAMECPDHVVPLGRYEEPEARIAVGKYVGMAYAELTETERARQECDLWQLLDGRRRVQELSFDPLVLRMIFEAYPPDPVPQEVNTALIYSAYWERRVIRDRLSSPGAYEERRRDAVACRIAHAILFRESDVFDDAIREAELEDIWKTGESNASGFPWNTFEALRSGGAIESAGGVDRFRFFHQTLLEFAAARSILRAPLPIQSECVERVLTDLNNGRFIRCPILVQMAAQDAQAGGHSWSNVLELLLEAGSETACHLTLEILGKVTDNAFCLDILRQWKQRHESRLATCAVIAVTHYPKHRLDVGFAILENVHYTDAVHDAVGLCSDRLARIDPEGTAAFLSRTSPLLRAPDTDYNIKGHYKSALLICFDSGYYAALAILASIFDHLTPGLRESILAALVERVERSTAPAIAEFLRKVRHIVHGARANDYIAPYLNLLIRLHSVAPELAGHIAAEMMNGPQPDHLNDRALLQGGLQGGILRADETMSQALVSVLSGDPFERRAAAATLAFSDAAEHDGILARLLALDLPSLDKQVRNSLFDVAAAMSDAVPDKLLAFVGLCPYPDGAGRAWRKISTRLATDSPQSIRSWLLAQAANERSLSRMLAVGVSRVLQVHPGLFTDSEVRHMFDLARASDSVSLRAFVECIGAIASQRPDLASEIVAVLVKPRYRDIWAALAYSLKDCLGVNLGWVASCVPLFIATAKSRADDGMFALLLEALKDWPEPEFGALIELMEENLTAEVLAGFPSEKCQNEFLTLVRNVARHDAHRAWGLLDRAVVTTSGSVGSAAMAVANIVGHTSDESILIGALERMFAAAPHARQWNARNALHRGLRIIDEKIGGRRVIERFFASYAGIQDIDALEVLVRTVSRLASWTSGDTAELLRDTGHINGKVRSYMLKMTAH